MTRPVRAVVEELLLSPQPCAECSSLDSAKYAQLEARMGLVTMCRTDRARLKETITGYQP